MPRDQIEVPAHDLSTVSPQGRASEEACDAMATALAHLGEATDLLGEFAALPTLEARGIDKISERLLFIRDVMQKHLDAACRAFDRLEAEADSHRPPVSQAPPVHDDDELTEFDLQMALHAQRGIFEALDWIDSVEIGVSEERIDVGRVGLLVAGRLLGEYVTRRF